MQICHIWENAKNLAYKHWMLTFTRARMHNFAQSHAALNGVFYCQQQNLYWSDLAIRTVFSFAHIIYHSVSASPVAKGELNPPNKALSPLNWNMKHYKSVWVCQFLKCRVPLHKPKAPLLKTFWQQFWVQLSPFIVALALQGEMTLLWWTLYIRFRSWKTRHIIPF